MSNYDPNAPQPGEPQQPGSTPPPPPPPGYSTSDPAGQAPPPAYSNQPTGGQAPPPPPAYSGQGQAPAYGNAMPGYEAGPVGPVTRPKSMDTAVKLMQAGGVLALLSLLSVFFMRDSMRDAVEDSMRKADPNVSTSDIDAAMSVGLAFGIVFGLLGAALWFWMASANGKGKSWARVVATVFFAISVLSTLFSLFAQTSSAISKVLGLIMLAIGAAAIYFMYQKESTAYYQAASGPRR